MPLYLGPLGRMRQLRAPRPDVEIDHPRQGGTHVALSGARTVDYLGSRGEYEFSWTWLDDAERDYLEALRDRHVRGPLRFVLPGWRTNRLSRQAASVGYGGRDLHGVTPTAGTTAPADAWPDDAPPAGDALAWSGWAPGSALRLDRDHPAPVLPGEVVTASVYVQATHAITVRITADLRTATGYTAAINGTATTLEPHAWSRLAVTVPTTAGVLGCSPAIVPTATPNPNAVVTVAAAQVEPGAAPSAWSLGGGAPVVAVDTMPITAARRGFSHPTLTLLEL
ncbi:hypothetical protein [Saccharopolyspora sp. 6V]|uniref:hypothetical protein n=1 Tax=Saccharopolyspora sp. 6V TaxID=2877239 RepID=UPI001CD4A82C|nr:hypothetical protein [Saccharopolyspora sp. 6V]MCA1195139.1 hypothetical protein [Saccharopolyspora sp. 6V]